MWGNKNSRKVQPLQKTGRIHKSEDVFTLRLRDLIPKYIPKRNECHVHQKTGRRMFIATFFIIAPNWKPSAGPSAGERTYRPPPTPRELHSLRENCSRRQHTWLSQQMLGKKATQKIYIARLHVCEDQEHLRVRRGAASGWECTDWKRSLLECWKCSFLIRVVVTVHTQM